MFEGKLNKIFTSEVCIKLLALSINQYCCDHSAGGLSGHSST